MADLARPLIGREAPAREPKQSSGSIHMTCLSALVQTARSKRGIIPHCMNDPQPEGHMASLIGRRKFLATLGGAAAAWPLAARAQQAERTRRIGFLRTAPPPERELEAFLRGLADQG